MKKLWLLLVLFSASRCFAGTIGACVSGSTVAQLLGTTCSVGAVQLDWSQFLQYNQDNLYAPVTSSDITVDFEAYARGALGVYVITFNGLIEAATLNPNLGAAYELVEMEMAISGGGRWGLSSASTMLMNGVDVVVGSDAAEVEAGCNGDQPAAYIFDNTAGQTVVNPSTVGVCQDWVPWGNIVLFSSAWAGGDFASFSSATYTLVDATPEPGTLGLLALGSLGLAFWRRRKAVASQQ